MELGSPVAADDQERSFHWFQLSHRSPSLPPTQQCSHDPEKGFENGRKQRWQLPRRRWPPKFCPNHRGGCSGATFSGNSGGDLHPTCTPRSGSDVSQIHLRCFLSARGFTLLCAVGDDGGSSAVTNELRRGRTMDCCGLATHSTVKASVAEHSSAQEAAAIGCECMRRCGEVDLTVTPD